MIYISGRLMNMRNASRLQRFEDQDNLRKASILALVTVGVMLTAFFVGIPILVRLAIFIGELNSANRPVDKNDLIPPTPPRILLSYIATNSAIQKLTGLSEPGATVYLTKNGEIMGNVITKEDGVWEFGRVELSPGDNKFIAQAIDQAGNKSQNSTLATLKYLTKTPDLTVDAPTDHQVATENNGVVEIKGSTNPGIQVTVNDRFLIVGPDGRFTTNYVLNEGENALVFVAFDLAGNQTRKEIVVEYRK